MLPLLLPDLRASLRAPGAPLLYGMATGVGFGVGEAWYLAWGIARTTGYSSLPAYYFAGYASERLVVCFAHGVTASVAMAGIARGGDGQVRGHLGAVGLHTALNLGPMLRHARVAVPLLPELAMVAALILLSAAFVRLRAEAAAARVRARD